MSMNKPIINKNKSTVRESNKKNNDGHPPKMGTMHSNTERYKKEHPAIVTEDMRLADD